MIVEKLNTYVFLVLITKNKGKCWYATKQSIASEHLFLKIDLNVLERWE
jgi:hypothetical protein